MKCPPIDPDLIAYLDRIYPDRVPDTNECQYRKYGNVEVVRHLKMKHKEQEEQGPYVSP